MSLYSKGQIYTIRSKSCSDLVYVGSTCNPLHKRMCQHRHDFKAWKEGNFHYLSCFEIFKIGNEYIEWFKDFPTDSKKKLEKREGYVLSFLLVQYMCTDNRPVIRRGWRPGLPIKSARNGRAGGNVRLFNVCVNKQKNTGMTPKERRDAKDKEVAKEYNKQYQETHKEHIKEVSKKWHENNKEQQQQYKKEKWRINREALLAKQNQKGTCECGANFTHMCPFGFVLPAELLC